ncbi:hypothetical protein ACEYW6_29420 [Nostoc sp. UIC 10607]|uniref:hypothetical protein n=1 Tax=Nostoc sp. UIC 10607 TaxID=3045935 RepID=UPI0039A0B610
MVLIKASPEGIEQIKQSIKHKGWTVSGDRKNNADALIIVSQQLFKKYVKKYLKINNADEEPLTSEQLTKLVNQEQKIFTPTATNKVNTYIYQLKKQKFTIKDFIEEIEIQCLYADRVTSRNWRYFQKGKEIDDDIFEAFCTALEIKNWDNFAIYHPIYNKNATDQTRLVEGLSSFNHRTQIKLLKTNFSNPNKPFLVANTCKYSQTWMLRRLELEIENTNRLKCKPFLLSGSQFSSRSINELSNRFEEQYPITRLVKSLKNENLLVVIDNPYDCKEIINDFWMPLVKKLTTTKTPGIMFMFLLSNNQANEREIESTQIIELPPANPFKEEDKEDIVNALLDIGAKIQNPLSQDNAEKIADILIQKSNGDTLKLLQEIYNHFKSKTTNFADVWQKYP